MKAIWNTANGSKAFNAFVWCKGKDASGFMVLEWRFSKLKALISFLMPVHPIRLIIDVSQFDASFRDQPRPSQLSAVPAFRGERNAVLHITTTHTYTSLDLATSPRVRPHWKLIYGCMPCCCWCFDISSKSRVSQHESRVERHYT